MSFSYLKNQKLLIKSCISVILILILSACSNFAETSDSAPILQAGVFTQEVSASGEVIPIKWKTLSYPNGAADLEVFVAEGDQVARNEILVTSNDHRLEASLYQAMSALERAQLVYDQVKNAPTEVALDSADAAYKNALANLRRQEDLGADETIIEAAQADFEAAFANLESVVDGASEEEIAAAEYDLMAAELTLEEAENAFDLRAPYSGTIVEVYIQSGDSIGALQPVVILADLSSYKVVTTDLSEVDVTRLDEGKKADIVFDAIPDITLEATVDKIAEKASGVSSVYYEVTLVLDEVPEALRWGMTAFVTFPVD